MTITEVGHALRARRISSVDLTKACLNQIEKFNSVLNTFVTVTRDSALVRASELDRELARGTDRGPLHGIPIAHKDLIWTNGVRTTSGSKILRDFVPNRDAAVVRKLSQAGAVMVGKTGLHEFGYGTSCDNPFFGTIRNPRNRQYSPGGSSGGSGSAVATEMAFIATGTDTAGSIRVPASFCGVIGLKPTYGVVDRSGVQPLGFSLDHVGLLARTVDDVRLGLDALSDAGLRKAVPATLKEIRVGLPENFYFETVAPEVKSAVLDSARHAEALGASVIPVRVPDVEALNIAGLTILMSEAAAVHQTNMHRRDDFGADVLALLDQGSLVSAPDYVNAQRQRKLLLTQFHGLFKSIDCLVTPTTPITAPRIKQGQVEVNGSKYNTRALTTRFVSGVNTLGFPALSMPCGETQHGLPIGLQLIGRPFEENVLFMLGGALSLDMRFQSGFQNTDLPLL